LLAFVDEARFAANSLAVRQLPSKLSVTHAVN
jgi:hypothetical protein